MSLPARLGAAERPALLPALLSAAAAGLDVLQQTRDDLPPGTHRLMLRPHRYGQAAGRGEGGRWCFGIC